MLSAQTRASFYGEEFCASLSNKSLHLLLLPTEQCNFRCSYCYEKFEVGRMDPKLVQGLKCFLDRRLPDLTNLEIDWFGGEPLAAKNIVIDISEHICKAVRERHDLDYRAAMTTNGYNLTTELLARLVALGIRSYQISLDGPEELHNRTRRKAGGQGTFDQIWSNLLSFRDSDIDLSVTIRIHLTSSNLPVMDDFMATIRDTFLGDPRFSVFLKPVGRLGGPNDDEIEVVPEVLVASVLRRLETVLYGEPTDPSTCEPHICYAAKPNSFVIRANGSVGKCTVILDDPRNAIGKLLPDGSLALTNEQFRPWLKGWESLDPEVLSCPLHDLPDLEDTASSNIKFPIRMGPS